MKRDFLRLSDLSPREHRQLLDRAKVLKAKRQNREEVRTLAGRTLALIFEKASTRTRLSFEAAMAQLGGSALTLPLEGSQMARGEPLEDTARVVSGYCDAIVMRTHAEMRLLAMAKAATVPVINGLTDEAHPVQLLADLLTVEERVGALRGKKMAFVGDGSSNMGRSWVEAAGLFEFDLVVASPKGYTPPAGEVTAAKRARIVDDPKLAVEGADVVSTDVWTSMGQEQESAARLKAFTGYCVDGTLMRLAPKAIVLHCLPAHRGEEISADVLEGPQSAVFQQAENRMHAQKALLELLLLS
ncbi:MAG: ornithine carbamoyltransferase [Myxococcaceae bacterium]